MASIDIPAGAVVKENGDVVIPASRRPDGTMRKERKIKSGHVPQEEQTKFQTRHTQMAQGKPKLPPGMAPPAEKVVPASSKSKNNRRKKKKNTSTAADEEAEVGVAALTLGGGGGAAGAAAASTAADEEAEVGVAALTLGGGGGAAGAAADGGDAADKRLRKLRKKLRQARDLESKVKNGDTNPDEEQQQKLAGIPALEQEIAELEASAARDGGEAGSGGAGLEGAAVLATGAEVEADTAKEGGEQEVDEAALEKKVRALKKRLRAVAELEARRAAGGGAPLGPDQEAKLARKQELLDELHRLIGVEAAR
eukprot:CAMPEP_0194744470 /NCGR_PEP_ID=MMETSP0296-20130528/100888_1 /TAXON_ID=39354 /ORGANISM="Heterosigma akashiwo, Strain CCMP2393" /LENGTH=309 /DNA_ID=CAMNT_0039656621 /DNA_START=14 /DNA_END=944 /DNA_ORIENTATION=-